MATAIKQTPNDQKLESANDVPAEGFGSDEARGRLLELVKGFRIAMLVTREGKSSLASRPMTIAQVEDDGTLWFMTSMTAEQTRALEFHSKVLVVCQSITVYVSVAGKAELVDDRAKIDELWSEPARLWFPEGKADPNLVLIKVSPTEGEFWDQSGLKGLRFLVDAAKSYVTGERLEPDPRSHAQASL